MVSKQFIKSCKKIKAVISDIDGILTDGGMYYSEKGEVFKKFNTRDGMAVELMKEKIVTILITQEKSKIALQRAKKLKISDIHVGIVKKELLLPKICKKYNVKPSEILYIGDDVNDYEIMKKVGLSATPADGMDVIKKISDYICVTKGGDGVFREIADLILKHKHD